MLDQATSRRTVIASAAVGAAVLAPAVLLKTHLLGSARTAHDQGITFMPALGASPTGKQAAESTTPVSAEILAWQQAVGRSFRIAGPVGSVAGVLTLVAIQAALGTRPANVRQQPFWLRFELDPGYSAAGGETYFVESGVVAPMNLFLQGSGGKLAALLN